MFGGIGSAACVFGYGLNEKLLGLKNEGQHTGVVKKQPDERMRG